jgi:hypothetical protein
MMKWFTLITLFLTGCAELPQGKHYIQGIDYYVKDFPKLSVNVKEISKEEINKKCDKHKPFSKRKSETLACSEISFVKKSCNVFVTKDVENWVLEHELAHCEGGDHDGVLEKSLKEYNDWLLKKEIIDF